MLVHAFVSLLVSVCVTLIAHLLRGFGRFHIYRKIVYKKDSPNVCLQILGSNGQLKLCAPVWLEFVNTKRKPVILRDISLILFNGDEEVGKMVQINRSINTASKNDSKENVYGNKGKYSFVVQSESVANFDVLYWLKYNGKDFDRILFSYYTSRGKRILKDFVDFPDGWQSKHRLKDVSWQEIK